MPPTTTNFFWGRLADVLLEFTIANLTFVISMRSWKRSENKFCKRNLISLNIYVVLNLLGEWNFCVKIQNFSMDDGPKFFLSVVIDVCPSLSNVVDLPRLFHLMKESILIEFHPFSTFEMVNGIFFSGNYEHSTSEKLWNSSRGKTFNHFHWVRQTTSWWIVKSFHSLSNQNQIFPSSNYGKLS